MRENTLLAPLITSAEQSVRCIYLLKLCLACQSIHNTPWQNPYKNEDPFNTATKTAVRTDYFKMCVKGQNPLKVPMVKELEPP